MDFFNCWIRISGQSMKINSSNQKFGKLHNVVDLYEI